MKKVFISHSSEDKEILDEVTKTIGDMLDKDSYIFTHEDGIPSGEERGKALLQYLRECEYMIAFVTDSYLRSIICISEISSFWFQKKPIFAIVYNGKRGKEFLAKLTGTDLICFDTGDGKPERISAELRKQASKIRIRNTDKAVSWIKAKPAESNRPFIGSEEIYEKVIQYCLRNGVRQMRNGSLDHKALYNQFVTEHPEEIYLAGTTHAGMTRFKETFAEAVANGTDLYWLIGDRDSEFCQDVAAIEAPPTECGGDERQWKQRTEEEDRRIAGEFDTVKNTLKQIRRNANRKAAKKGTTPGRIMFGCTFTLIRQTVTMTIDESRNHIWAWFSVTMPPKRAMDGTLGIEVSSFADDGDDEKRSLAETLKEHVREIRELARMRGALIEVDDHTELPVRFIMRSPSLEDARNLWEERYQEAERQMNQQRVRYTEKILIEIAAQHPLKDGRFPDTAFAERLETGIELYERLTNQGKAVHIYVPGSIHIPDTVSLSSAGIRYLKESGRVDPAHILDEDVNQKYKGEDGVYNSADECYVASEIYRDGKYTDVYCICSANQMLRKKLFYYWFYVIPHMIAVPDDSFHSDIYEIFESIPDVLLNDHDWQDSNSRQFIRTRKERKPGYKDE